MNILISSEFSISNIVHFIFGVCIGYLFVSVAESWLHRHLLHANAKLRKLSKNIYPLGAIISQAYYSHHIVHHGLTFKDNHVTQFRSEADLEKVDRSLNKEYADIVRAESYSVTIRIRGILRYIAPLLPFYLLFYFLFPLDIALGITVPLLAYPLAALVIHPLLHMPITKIKQETHPLIYSLFQTWYIKKAVVNHFLHHKYHNCNYNVLLGGDIILGFNRRADQQDIIEMKGLGLLID